MQFVMPVCRVVPAFQVILVLGVSLGGLSVSFGGEKLEQTAKSSVVTVLARGAEGVAPGKRFDLSFVATMKKGWHIYSLKETFGVPTKIEVIDRGPFLEGGTASEDAPKVHHNKILEVDLREHHGKAKFQVPLQAPKKITDGEYAVTVRFSYQPCDASSCLSPVQHEFKLPVVIGKAGRDPKLERKATSPRLTLRGWGVEHVRAGEKFEVELEVAMMPGWHIYSMADKSGSSVPTTIGLTPWSPPGEKKASSPGTFTSGGIVVESKPREKKDIFGGAVFVHDGIAIFRVPVVAPKKLRGQHELPIFMSFGACDKNGCDPVVELSLRLPITIEPAASEQPKSRPRGTRN